MNSTLTLCTKCLALSQCAQQSSRVQKLEAPLRTLVRRRTVAQAEATQQLSTARAFTAAIAQAKARVARASTAQAAARTSATEQAQAEAAKKVQPSTLSGGSSAGTAKRVFSKGSSGKADFAA